jgi:hypothetical protein
MTRLFLAPGQEIPHMKHPFGPATTACGRPLNDMKEITEVQALVWLGNRRCKRCAQEIERVARGIG